MSTDLPISAYLDEICRAVDTKSTVLIQAEPGSGKTTRVPLAIARQCGGNVWVLEPRRLATTLAAGFVAEFEGGNIGEFVGYRVRHDKKVSKDTRLTFMTEGMFLRLAQIPDEISTVDTIIIDEFHERHLQTDVAYVISSRLRQLNPRLKLVLMSATLDVSPFAAEPETEVFNVPGRVYPVTTSYRPMSEGQRRPEAVVEAIRTMVVDPNLAGNVLAFLPGTSEIMRVCEGLRGLPGWEAVPLTASLTRQQNTDLFRSSSKRVYVSTNVAESSVTLPNIGGVVDTGVAKQPGFASWSGLPTLDVKRVAQSSCIQRQGRAGRTGPGICYRLFSESDYLGRDPYSTAEISRLDLSQVILQLLVVEKEIGKDVAADFEHWEWIEKPNAEHWQEATSLLTDIGALQDGKLTDGGRRMAAMPFHPRLAAIIENATRLGRRGEGIAIACLLNEGGLMQHRFCSGAPGSCDLARQLNAWRDRDENGLDRQAVKRFTHELRTMEVDVKALPSEFPPLGSLVLAGFADRVAKKRTVGKFATDRDPKVTFNFCRGRGGVLNQQSCVQQHEFIVVLAAEEDPSRRRASESTMIRLASAVTREELEGMPLVETAVEHIWSEKGQRVDAVERKRYGQIVLREKKIDGDPHGDQLLAEKLLEKWPGPFSDDRPLQRLNNRIFSLQKAGLAEGLEPFLGELFAMLVQMICDGKSSFREVGQRTLGDYLGEQVSYEHHGLLKALTPADLKLPNGRTVSLEYGDRGTVCAVAHVQDFYGVDQTLSLADGKIKVAIQMLGPHGRPIQTTEDLRMFWQSGYAVMAKDLRGRYPKHHWPENPETAPAIRTKSRLPRE